MKKSTITTIVVILVIIILAGIYFWTIGGQSSTSSSSGLLVSSTSTDQSSVGMEELVMLNQVSTIKINTGFFSSDLFLSLQDFTQQIQTTDIGKRPDPFAPVPGIPSPFSSSQSASQSLSQPSSGVQSSVLKSLQGTKAPGH